MSRTIVISDPHGQVAIMRRALDHAAFEPGHDRLVLAGDFVDAGLGGFECIELADEMGAEVLVGNHEYAFFCHEYIDEGLADPRLQDYVHSRVRTGEFKFAVLVDDSVVVTHAGVSADWQGLYDLDLGTPAMLVQWLQQEFVGTADAACGPGGSHRDSLWGPNGPLWFRAYDPSEVLRGVVQVVGHTPPELYGSAVAARELGMAGFHLVDPFARGWMHAGRPDPPPLRYGVIENGQVTVVQE